MVKRVMAFLLTILIVAAAPFSALCLNNHTLDGIESAVGGAFAFKMRSLGAENESEFLDRLSEHAGNYSSDWYYIALSQHSGTLENEESVNALKSAVAEFYEQGLNTVKVTDMQRVALALSAFSVDITDVDSHNLLADSSYNREQTASLAAQGVNSLSFALLLLDSADYEIPSDAKSTRESIVDRILSKEMDGGGFALMGDYADIDITAIVLQALAPYKGDEEVSQTVERCLAILSKRQDKSSGAYKSFSGKATAETTAQVVLALTALGINPDCDERFVKNGNSVLDGLMLFRCESGGFSHFVGEKEDNMATYQSLNALISLKRFLKGEKSFYSFPKPSEPDNSQSSAPDSMSSNTTSSRNSSSSASRYNSRPELKSSSTSKTSSANSASRTDFEKKKPKKSSLTEKSKKKASVSSKGKTAETAPAEASESMVSAQAKPASENNSLSENKINGIYITCALFAFAYVLLFALKRRKK